MLVISELCGERISPTSFFRKDITNVNDFFKRKGVNVLTVKEFFDFVVDPSKEDAEAALERLSDTAAARTNEEMTAQERVEEEVFKQIFIPRTLIEVSHPERDIKAAKTAQQPEQLLAPYQAVAGIQVKIHEISDLVGRDVF